MKKVLLILLIIFVSIFTFAGCTKEEEKEINSFKKDYEDINGTENKSGKVHREVSISEDNVFVEITAEELVKKIDNKETFYVYFGSRLCPWCRSTIEKADQVSRENLVDKIYYVDIWDDEGNEILRDKYVLNANGELELVIEGTESYKKLLTVFDSLLEDYVLNEYETVNDEQVLKRTVKTGEKRIFAPNYFYVDNGVAVRMTTGTSDLQKDSRETLTEEILKDEEKLFNEFFVNSCDDLC